MKNFEFLSQEEYDLAEESEPISRKDIVSAKAKEAFSEMQRQAELGKNNISEDQLLPGELEEMIGTSLNEKEKEVIRRKYFYSETYEQIGDHLGISAGRAQQIGARALERLREPRNKKYLEGMELPSRNRDKQHHILEEILLKYLKDPRIDEFSEMHKALSRIYYSTEGTQGKILCNLDPRDFKRICDEIKTILNNYYSKGNNKSDIAYLLNLGVELRNPKYKYRKTRWRLGTIWKIGV